MALDDGLPDIILRIIQNYGQRCGEPDWEESLTKEVRKIANSYYNGTPEGTVSFASERTRMAYIFRYVLFGVASLWSGLGSISSVLRESIAFGEIGTDR